jgi:NAD(P)H dehydrogenase (quinone)
LDEAATLALTGSTGGLGGRVAARLAGLGHGQRLIVREPAKAPVHEGVEIAVASSYGAASEMRQALDGVKTLYLVSGREAPERLGEHRIAIDSAKAAGVERIVYVSFLGAGPEATFTFARDHWATEEAIRASGLAFSFLRSSLYLDFMPSFVGPERTIRGPGGHGRFAPVARDDLADAAVAVLAAEGAHDGRTYELTGPELLTLADVAARLGAYTGQEYAYVEQTLAEAWESRRDLGLPDAVLEGAISSYLAIADGSLAVETDAVAELTGHRPLTLEQCLDASPELLATAGPA